MAAEEGRAAIWEVDAQDRREAPVRQRPAQSERHGLGARHQRAVDRGQRARRDRQRPGARLPDLGEGRRLLRLAVELLRRARRRARAAAAPGHGGQGDRARLRAGLARRAAGPGVLRRARHAAAIRQRRLRRRARLVEPQAAVGLQGGVRAVHRRQAGRAAGRFPDRLPERRRARRRAGRSAWRWTRAARCWWPTTSATRSGAWPRHAESCGTPGLRPEACNVSKHGAAFKIGCKRPGAGCAWAARSARCRRKAFDERIRPAAFRSELAAAISPRSIRRPPWPCCRWAPPSSMGRTCRLAWIRRWSTASSRRRSPLRPASPVLFLPTQADRLESGARELPRHAHAVVRDADPRSGKTSAPAWRAPACASWCSSTRTAGMWARWTSWRASCARRTG